jgi:hypothetical protein
MTAQELNTAITEGTKKYGKRNLYLASAEYRKLYAQYESVKRSEQKIEIVTVDHLGEGFFLRIGKNTYVANLGDAIGCGAGPINFNTIEQAKSFCNKKGYAFTF